MIESVIFFGSYATVWLGSWILCALAATLLYPLIRNHLLKWHPEPASTLLLIIFSVPMLLSLFASTLLFIPEIEASLVSDHCHSDCQAHVPKLSSVWLAASGLIIMGALFVTLLTRLSRDLNTAHLLHKQLSLSSKNQNGIYILEDSRPIVFTLGWWRNNIYLTKGLISQCQNLDLEIILAHETAHSQRRDNMRLLVARLMLLVLPSSLANKFYEDLHVLSESACDFAAASRFGSTEVAETLLKIQRVSMQCFELDGRSIVSEFNGSAIETRIKNLLTGRSLSTAQQLGSKLAIAGLVVLSFALLDPLHQGIEMMLGR
jgi:Zn-dependent protease with chaperone function